MRWLSLALIAGAVFVLPASAASLDPRLLGLHQIDVPARYFFDRDNSFALSKAHLADTNAAGRRLAARSGFVNGYFRRYLNSDPPRWRYINSGAFVFRRADGAKLYLASVDKSLREPAAVRRGRVDLGNGGSSYVSRLPKDGTWVAWRSGRVVGVVGCQEMTGHRTLALALARKQQRCIATARG